jgi:Zn-dependent membrane protease YugP
MFYYELLLPAMIFALWAQFKVNYAFKEYSRLGTYYGMTGYEAARRILDANGLRNVQIERIRGNLTDHYDPRSNVIRLSDGVYNVPSIAAIGVAAHEAGHAIQYAEGYSMIKLRNAIIPVTQIGSTLSWPLILLGMIMSSSAVINIGILMFATVTLFQIITLPVEYDASNRAVKSLVLSGAVTDNEVIGVKKVLSAAALTYVAALAVSIANLLRMFALFGGRRER